MSSDSPRTDERQPMTAAGRRLDAALEEAYGPNPDATRAILAIEAEASPAASGDALRAMRDFIEWWDQVETFEPHDDADKAYILMSVTDDQILDDFRDQFARLSDSREATDG